jgi:MoxR-like ATPase
MRTEVVEPLKNWFVGRDEVIDLIALAAVAGEHLFLFGPPGTAKSAVIRQFASAVHGRYFEYLLTRFSEPNEIFGPIDLVRLREGTVATVITGMLPEAEFVFLDELFNANSAILNNLLTVLNERVYRRGSETHALPLLALFSASNRLPEDEALGALFDRFLLRCHVDQLPRDAMPNLLGAGWALERNPQLQSGVSSDDLRELSGQIRDVDLSAVRELYAEMVFKVRDVGVNLSDRRAVKILKLLAASSLLLGRTAVIPSDLWVLRYVWDREEQIAPLRALVNRVLEQHAKDGAAAHPLAAVAGHVDPERVARELEELDRAVNAKPHSLTIIARLREQASHLLEQAAWVADDAGRRHLSEKAAALLKRLS